MRKFLGLVFLSLCLVSCNSIKEEKQVNTKTNEVVEENKGKEESIKEEKVDNSLNREEDVTLLSLELIGYKETFKGEDFSVGDLKVFGIYSDSSKKEITDYKVDSSEFNRDKAGSYSILITYLEASKSYSVDVTCNSGEMELPLV